MKKVLKIVGISLLIIVLLLVASPFLFQNKIKGMVKTFINENVNAKVDFTDVSLSFLSSFPKANLTIDNLTITNFAPFEDEQLVNSKSIELDFSITELFKDATEGPIKVDAFYINEALISLKTNTQGIANWDIAKAKETTTTNTTTKSDPFVFQLDNYGVTNSAFTYIDEKEKLALYITDFNHSGNGTFSETISELETQTNMKVSFKMAETEYLTNNTIDLDAIVGLDLKQNKYTFKENKLVFNQLPIEFDGFVQLIENGQKIDLSFKNTGSTFKDFLAVIPKAYSKDLANVNTTGNFNIIGLVKGESTETTIPTLDINILSNNASFKYNDLPKGVKDIVINTSIKNTTGKSEDTYVDIQTLNFKIDQDVFNSSAKITNLTGNTSVNANIDGVLNLANLTKAYPVELENELTGLLKAKLNTAFDMKAIDTNAYQRIKNNGTVSITDFKFSSEDIVNPLNISKANVSFNPGLIKLEQFVATSGKTDLNATGTINNLLGFLLSDKKLQGNFNVKSNTFAVSDFMVEGENASKKSNNEGTTKESLKIPAFLDATINADAKTVYYDNLILKDVKGELVVKDEKAQLINMSSNIFNGKLALNGLVDTKSEVPTFNMNLNAKDFDISQSFNDLDLLKQLAPIAKLLQGKLNSTIALSGKLGSDFTPDLNTISGNALAELLTAEFKPKNEKVVSLLEDKLSFLDFSKLDLKDVVANITFDNGKVSVKPMDIVYKDIKIQLGGSHNLQNLMDYKAVLLVPAKYLGSDINRLIGKINDPEVNNIAIPVTANITGSLLQPDVKTDLTSGVKSLTSQLIEIQKQKLIGQGTDQIKDLLGNVLGGNNSSNNSSANQTTTNSSSNPVKDVLGSVLGGNNNTPKDSTKPASNPVKDVLGGLFGKKKKKDTEN
jgi:hypothetical protein